MARAYLTPIIGTVLGCFLIGIGFLYAVSKPAPPPTVHPLPSPTISSTPTPITLKAGPETYHISQSSHQGPSIAAVTFDPLDVKRHGLLTLTVITVHPSVVTQVKGILTSDTNTFPLSFNKSTSQANNTTWKTTMTVPDTLWYRYMLTITAYASDGQNTITVAPRSP